MATPLARPKDSPWELKTPPGTSEYTMHTDERDGKEIHVCTVGSTVLHYDARCIDDLHSMLKTAGDWVELGGADEQKPAKDGSVEGWGRSEANPVGGWYGDDERVAFQVASIKSTAYRWREHKNLLSVRYMSPN